MRRPGGEAHARHMSDSGNDVAAAQAALAAGQWQRAWDAFSAASGERAPAAYEGMAQAAWWRDDGTGSLRSRASAYRSYRDLGDDLGAARAASALGYDSYLFGEGAAVARGWLGRARTLLEPLEEAAEHGWLAVREAELTLGADHDTRAAFLAAERAEAIGRRLRDSDLEVVGTALAGLAQTLEGGDGIPRLEVAVAAATGGDVVDLMWLGKVYCWLINACQATHDTERATDWCRRVEALCEENDLVPLLSVCRTQYASLHVAVGSWRRAERELSSVVERTTMSTRASRIEAIVQLGELRRRQGRNEEAEELLAQAEFDPVAIVGRALLRLDRGEAAQAWEPVQRLLTHFPRTNRLGRVLALPAAVTLALAADHPDAARAAAEELREIADLVGTDPLLGLAAAADAALADPSESAGLWLDAVRRFNRAGLRFDEAQTRLRLARVLIASGGNDEAGAHLAAAAGIFTDLGAASNLSVVERLQSRTAPEGARSNPLTPREVEVLRLVAQGCSNMAIAEELVVSEHTVHRHVSNILTKLDQPSRAGATAYAIGHGLI